MWLMLQQEKPDDYVIATNKNHSVREFVEKVCQVLKFNIVWKGKKDKEVGLDAKTKKIIIKVDPEFYRPNDVENLLGDSTKAKRIIKWQPKTSLQQLINIMIKEEFSLIKQKKLY